jgi:hypothetical protein
MVNSRRLSVTIWRIQEGRPVQFHCGVVPAVMNVPTLVVTEMV